MPGLPSVSLPSLSARSLAGRSKDAPLLVTFSVLVGIAAAGVTSTIRALPLNPLPTPEFSLPFVAFGSDSKPDPVGRVPGVLQSATRSVTPELPADGVTAPGAGSGSGEPFAGIPQQPAPAIPLQWTPDTSPDVGHWSSTPPVVQPYHPPEGLPRVPQLRPAVTPSLAPSQPSVFSPAQPSVFSPAQPIVAAPSTTDPSTTAPSTTAPQIAAPASTAPAQPAEAAPSTAAPSTAAPSTAAPSTAAPQIAAPATTAPAATTAATTAPAATSAPATTTAATSGADGADGSASPSA